MEICERNIKQNRKKDENLARECKQIQLKRCILMEQYNDIFNEFEEIAKHETDIKNKREDNNIVLKGFYYKSDELILLSDKIIDCIHEYQKCQHIMIKDNKMLKRFLGSIGLIPSSASIGRTFGRQDGA